MEKENKNKDGVLVVWMTPMMLHEFITLQMEFELPFNIKVHNKSKFKDTSNGNKIKFVYVEIDTKVDDLQFLLDTLNVIDVSKKVRK